MMAPLTLVCKHLLDIGLFRPPKPDKQQAVFCEISPDFTQLKLEQQKESSLLLYCKGIFCTHPPNSTRTTVQYYE